MPINSRRLGILNDRIVNSQQCVAAVLYQNPTRVPTAVSSISSTVFQLAAQDFAVAVGKTVTMANVAGTNLTGTMYMLPVPSQPLQFRLCANRDLALAGTFVTLTGSLSGATAVDTSVTAEDTIESLVTYEQTWAARQSAAFSASSALGVASTGLLAVQNSTAVSRPVTGVLLLVGGTTVAQSTTCDYYGIDLVSTATTVAAGDVLVVTPKQTLLAA